MKLARMLFAVVVIAAACGTPLLAGGNANFVLGGRSLDEDIWTPVEDQGVFGVNVDFGKEGWPIQLVAGLHVSTDEQDDFVPFLGSVEVTGTVSELSFGVLKAWKPGGGRTRPFVGGGVAVVTAEFELKLGGAAVSEDDTSPGIYAHGGVFWRIGRRFNLGGDVRVVRGTDVELFGLEADADYEQFGILVGWGWPSGS